MSKHQHHTVANPVHDAIVLTAEQLEDRYGITISEDGTVWDPCEGREFPTIQAWAVFVDALDDNDYDDNGEYDAPRSRYRDD